MSGAHESAFWKLKLISGTLRVLLASLLLALAYPLLYFTSQTRIENKTGSYTKASTSLPSAPTLEALLPPFDVSHLPQKNNQRLYITDTLSYYKTKLDMADERIQLDSQVSEFIKHPPLETDLKLYERYARVKSDFLKIRSYRKQLQALPHNHTGRNRNAEQLREHHDKYMDVEAILFYQLEKIVYFARKSYQQWHLLEPQDVQQTADFDSQSLHNSEETARLFEDFSQALNRFSHRVVQRR